MAKPKNSNLVQLEDMETEKTKEKRTVKEMHSYACPIGNNGECNSTPNKLAKQKAKKARNEPTTQHDETMLSELQNKIITAVIEKMNERVDKTDKAVHYNTAQIDDLKKPLEFCHREITDLKKTKY
ncbi:hypothetical protein AMECASPLE_010199 [Ameca splendens]|uniref:Uncharacterized protein n=1 Tax=Ameca splendens TaxID=208324 RepID=A0ABV0YC90_9TELE